MTPEEIDSIKALLPDRAELEALIDATDFDKQAAPIQDQIIVAAQEIWAVLDYVDQLLVEAAVANKKIDVLMDTYLADPSVQYQRPPSISGLPKSRSDRRVHRADGSDAI